MVRKAFTLIELLVVISIIALLIAILLPALSKARQSALTTQCGIDQRSLGAATINYATDNRGVLPDFYYESDMETYAGSEGSRIFRMDASWKEPMGDYGAIPENFYSVSNPDFEDTDGLWKPGNNNAGTFVTIGRLGLVGEQGNRFATQRMKNLAGSGYDGTESKPAFPSEMDSNTIFNLLYVDLSRQYPMSLDLFVSPTTAVITQGANHVHDDPTEASGTHHTGLDGSTTYVLWGEMKARGEEKDARFWW